MAKFVLTDAYIMLGATNLSTWLKQIAVDLPRDVVDVTTMGATQKVNLPGLGDFSAQATFLQDFAAGGPDATAQTYIAGGTFTLEIRPTSGARSPTNPAYTCSVFIADYSPLSNGSVGVDAECTMSFKPAGNWTRLTA